MISTPYGFSTTADEILYGIDLTGKRVVITGGTGGIGLETSRSLAKAGAEIIIATHNIDTAEIAANDLREDTQNRNIYVEHLELSDLESVASFAKNFTGPLDILINNAGIMSLPTKEVSKQGYEMQFAVNHWPFCSSVRFA